MTTEIPINHAVFTLDEIARATGGRVFRGGGEVVGISTDTRTLQPRAAFVALQGPRFDGHDHLDTAATAGAAVVIVSRVDHLPSGVGVVQVDDTLRALGDLARAHRRRWASLPGFHDGRVVIAVGGSAGKTTTRRALEAVLERAWPGAVHATHANQNNMIGVPMTLLGLGPDHRFAVVELGTSVRGEIRTLVELTEPDVGVVTRIGAEHTEGIGSLDDVEAEEGDLFEGLRTSGAALGNADDERVLRQLQRARASRRIAYGRAEAAQYRLVSACLNDAMGMDITITRQRSRIGSSSDAIHASVPLLGEAGTYAALAALATFETVLGEALDGDTLTQALAALAGYRDGRMVPIERKDRALILDDTYNANPDSMRTSISAVRDLASMRGKRLILILGEMRELGSLAAEEHARLGEWVAGLRPWYTIAVAGESKRVSDAVQASGGKTAFCADAIEASRLACEVVEPNDVVLVKASRGVLAERIVNALLTTQETQRPST